MERVRIYIFPPLNRKILRIDYDFDFTLLGIISVLKDYRLCFYLNKSLIMNFIRSEDLQLTNENDEEIYFSTFYCFLEEGEIEFHLLANKGDGGFLIPEKKEVDYFLKINKLPTGEEQKIVLALRKIPAIQAVVPINPNTLKSKINLLF